MTNIPPNRDNGNALALGSRLTFLHVGLVVSEYLVQIITVVSAFVLLFSSSHYLVNILRKPISSTPLP